MTGPPEQAAVWLAIAAAGSGDFRRRVVAHAIRLERWYAAVEAVVEEEPSAFDAVLAEFAAVQD